MFMSLKLPIPHIRLLPYAVYSAEVNMAIDRYFLGLPGTILRFYGWEYPTLSFGRMNRQNDEIDLEYCRQKGIRKVQRISGGKTVLHHQELTYSLISDTLYFPSSVVETYRIISKILSDSFENFGLRTEMSPDKGESSNSSICFKEASAFELTVGGKKLVGSAQYRKRKRFFQHGSILLDIDWQMWKNTWRIPKESTELENRVTSFKKETGLAPEPSELAKSIADTFAKHFNATLSREDLSEKDWEEVKKLSACYCWEETRN